MNTEQQLSIAMRIIDEFLNAGHKEDRRKAAENGKELYKQYYGKEYLNKRDRK